VVPAILVDSQSKRDMNSNAAIRRRIDVRANDFEEKYSKGILFFWGSDRHAHVSVKVVCCHANQLPFGPLSVG